MGQRLKVKLESEYFELGQLDAAKGKAAASKGIVYTWKAEGGENWLELGENDNGAIGYLVLPRSISDGLVFPE